MPKPLDLSLPSHRVVLETTEGERLWKGPAANISHAMWRAAAWGHHMGITAPVIRYQGRAND